MATGWGIQLAKQAGEYLVAGELCRRGYLAATFSGNVRDYDIIAVSETKRPFTVQVKTILGGAFQIGDAGRFIVIEHDGEVQSVNGKHELIDDSVWVFVYLAGTSAPQYFVTTAHHVQQLIFDGYTGNLLRLKGRRPRNAASHHHALFVHDLEPFRDNWSLIERMLVGGDGRGVAPLPTPDLPQVPTSPVPA